MTHKGPGRRIVVEPLEEPLPAEPAPKPAPEPAREPAPAEPAPAPLRHRIITPTKGQRR